jgi:hypothetical protein
MSRGKCTKTAKIDCDLHKHLKSEAVKRSIPLEKLLNQIVKEWMDRSEGSRTRG